MGFGSNQALTSGLAGMFGRQLTPADQYNLGQWSASQAGYAPTNYTPSVWGELGP
jgi:hypothetical protein